MTQRHKAPLLIVIFVLMFSAFACRSTGDIPTPPGGRIPVSQEAADRLKSNFNREMQEASTGDEFRLFVTNEEITSLVSVYFGADTGLPLTDPQVWFTAGRVYITGTFSPTWPFSFRSVIVASAVVDQEKKIQVEIEHAQMGAFPFPEKVLTTLSQSVNETLAEMQLDLEVTTLEILEGELQVAGTRRTANTK